MMSSRLLILSATALVVSGCSTWRCRGFLNVNDMPTEAPSGAYRIAGVKFVEPSGVAKEVEKLYPRYLWLSSLDGKTVYTYQEEISRILGFTNALSSATPVSVTVHPIAQASSGWKTVGWPLCGTLGVMPAHFVEDVPAVVQVDVVGGRKLSRRLVSLVRMDRQYALTRYDMDSPPPNKSAFGERRDDGTIGTGSEMRDERMRAVFVNMVAAAILRAIAEYESAPCERVLKPATEFGPVDLSVYSAGEPPPPKSAPAPVAKATARPAAKATPKNEPAPRVVNKPLPPQPAAAPEKPKEEKKPAKVVVKSEAERRAEYMGGDDYRKWKSLLDQGFVSEDDFNRHVNEMLATP